MANCFDHIGSEMTEAKYLLLAMEQNDKEHPSSHSNWRDGVCNSDAINEVWYRNFVLINGKIGGLGKTGDTRQRVHGVICYMRVIELAMRYCDKTGDAVGALTGLCDILGGLRLSEKQVRRLIEVAQYGLPRNCMKTPFHWLYRLDIMQERYSEIKPQYANFVRYMEDGSNGKGSIDLKAAPSIACEFDGGDWPSTRKIAVAGGYGHDKSRLLNRLIGARMLTPESVDVPFELKNDPSATLTTMTLWYNSSESSLNKLFELPARDDELYSVKRSRIDMMTSMGIPVEEGATSKSVHDFIPADTMRYLNSKPKTRSYSNLIDAMAVLGAYMKSPMWPIVSHVTVCSAEFVELSSGTTLWSLPNMESVRDGTDNLLLLDRRVAVGSENETIARCMFGSHRFPSKELGAYAFYTKNARGVEDHDVDGVWKIEYWAGYCGARMFLGLPLSKE